MALSCEIYVERELLYDAGPGRTVVGSASSFEAAKLLLKEGFSGYSASRSYYAMFYIAEAFLEGDKMSFSKHSAVFSAFGREFADPAVANQWS